MLRKDYLNAEYTSEDKKLIALFQKQMQKINQLFQAALQEWDKTKALLHLRKMQAISTALKAEYGERAELRIPQEYLKGGIYIDDYLNNASSLSRLKNQWDSKLIMSRVAQLGPVHTEAVKALMENSKMLVSASIDGMEKYALTMLTKHQQSQAKIKLAEWVLSWDWLEKMKKNLTKIFENNGVVKFQDRAGRMRDMNRYVDMLTRTETKIANTQGTINRALESGVSKFEVVEHEDCCEICAEHNGKIYDISKWAVELPPYHPNCKGYIIPIVNEERINSKKEEKKEIINNLIKGKIKQVVLKEHLNWDQRKILQDVNINPKWYREILSSTGIKHIMKNHWVKWLKLGKWEIPVRWKDIGRIRFITSSYDSIKISDHKSMSWNYVIQYKKEIGDKIYDYRERIVLNKQIIEPQTMIIKKK